VKAPSWRSRGRIKEVQGVIKEIVKRGTFVIADITRYVTATIELRHREMEEQKQREQRLPEIELQHREMGEQNQLEQRLLMYRTHKPNGSSVREMFSSNPQFFRAGVSRLRVGSCPIDSEKVLELHHIACLQCRTGQVEA